MIILSILARNTVEIIWLINLNDYLYIYGVNLNDYLYIYGVILESLHEIFVLHCEIKFQFPIPYCLPFLLNHDFGTNKGCILRGEIGGVLCAVK